MLLTRIRLYGTTKSHKFLSTLKHQCNRFRATIILHHGGKLSDVATIQSGIDLDVEWQFSRAYIQMKLSNFRASLPRVTNLEEIFLVFFLYHRFLNNDTIPLIFYQYRSTMFNEYIKPQYYQI